ncbi:MAG: hypothetical protein UY97_C0027G0004 [Parcubacteria group bacterium GW2011_GWB1_57_6]|nr:MAG: hypothetical protein UY97_C0027G0004 [Parcubacteria group bacterium GW2011_GWB1_57_6]
MKVSRAAAPLPVYRKKFRMIFNVWGHMLALGRQYCISPRALKGRKRKYFGV